MPAISAPATLITIPLSHYCEKARWALDRAEMPYREEPHAPLLHLLATKRRGGGSVPMLVQGDLRLIDSTAILLHADEVRGGDLLYPREAGLRSEVQALEEYFDTKLGPDTRRWAYGQLLSQTKLLRSLWSEKAPRREAQALPLITPLTRFLVQWAYRITPESAERSLRRVREVFGEVDRILGDGRCFLCGGRFTAADLTFAALAAPVLFPGGCCAVLPLLEEVPAAMRDEVLRFRATAAGAFALRLFAEERYRT